MLDEIQSNGLTMWWYAGLGVGNVWQRVWSQSRLILLLLLSLGLCGGLCGCLTTFSVGTAAKPAKSYRAAPQPRDVRGDGLPTPQLLNFGFDLGSQELDEP